MQGIEFTNKGVGRDVLSADEVRAYFEPSFSRRTFNRLDNPFASEGLVSQVENWQAEGKTVVFTSGVFDLFHANHRTYLMHTKLAAAPHCWNKYGNPDKLWRELNVNERADFTAGLLARDLLKLVVSVDGNMAAAIRKGFNPAKGNSARPIYDWTTRARDVLSSSHEIFPGKSSFIADAVTIHDKVQPELAGTPHVGIMEIAKYVNPDVWSVFYESEDIIQSVNTTHFEQFIGIDVVVLESHDFYKDKLLGNTFGTTEVARRVGNTATNGVQA